MGGRTIAEWQQVMSSDEFADWMAYYQIDPFGSYRSDVQAANVAMWSAQPHAKKGHVFNLSDFMLKFGEPEKPKAMTSKEMQDRLKLMFGRTHG